MDSQFCKCGSLRGSGSKQCNPCHAAHMREWRKTHRLDGDARRKMNCRSYANVYLRRGLIERQPCEVENCVNWPQMHHDDYSQPLKVRWLCRSHHLELHSDGSRVQKDSISC